MNWNRVAVAVFLMVSMAYRSPAARGDPGAVEIARRNASAAREALVHSRRVVQAYRKRMDPVTRLLPSSGRDRTWTVRNSAADLYPFLVMAAYYTDRAVFDNDMHEILRNEVRRSTRLGMLSDDVLPGDGGFVHPQVDLNRLIFGSCEYAKDGLLPLTELLGRGAWFDRMVGIADDMIAHAPYETRFGRLPSLSCEVNGEFLQVLSRLAYLTGDRRYVDQAVSIAAFYFEEVIPKSNGLPAHEWDRVGGKPASDRFVLSDHGNEIAGGLSEIVLFLKQTGHPKYEDFKKPMSDLIHTLLDVGLNEDGVWYSAIAPSNRRILDRRHAHCWGYLFNAVYTTYLITGEERFLNATKRALDAVTDKPTYLDDPAGSGRKYGSNAYSDAIESAIVFLNRLPDPRTFAVLDECVARFLQRQRPDGIIEDWYGDGNYVRTALMYAFMKSQGCWLEPWREDARLGAVREDDGPLVTIEARQPWQGRVHFDYARHKAHFNMPVNYPRLNEFPEWFTVRADRLYRVRLGESEFVRLGGELIRGLEVRVAGESPTVLEVSPVPGPAYGTDEPETAKNAAAVQALLQRGIVGRDLPLSEVQAFTESRVAVIPPVHDAAEWGNTAEALRRRVLRDVVFRGEAARWRDADTRVQWRETIPGGPGYRIRKLRYEALAGMWIPAVLYEPESLSAPVPAVLNVNGHSFDKATPDKQIRCINQAKRGMIALNVEWLGRGQLATTNFRHGRMNQIDLCGTSGLAPFYLAMKRGLDVLLSVEHADPARVAVTGLSGGGWQTIVLGALDTRVQLANPVAGYAGYRTRARHTSDLGDSEQTPVDLVKIADYTHLTAMMAPRPTLLTYNDKDVYFASGRALPPLLEAARPIFALMGDTRRLRSHVNSDPGTHNFERDNREALYRMLGDYFYPDKEFDAREISCDGEIKTREQLHVDLPADNADFHSLAVALRRDLPRDPDIPTDKKAFQAWQQRARRRLRDIVLAKSYPIRAERIGREKQGEFSATYWRVRIGDDWTVPVVELERGTPKATVILLADGGRASAVAEAVALLEGGNRVLAADLFSFGESSTGRWTWLYALLVSSVGERALGIQASQLAAVARWVERDRRTGPVGVVATGPRSTTVALVAAGLEEKAIGHLDLSGALGSLRDVIDKNWTVEQAPELFCFGLLEAFDREQLVALVSPRPVRFR